MNTSSFEVSDNLTIAKSYYNAMLAKDFDKMANYLHDNVHFIGPLAEMHGKEAVVSAAKNLSQILGDIKIRSKFSYQNQIMFAYDFIFSAPISKLKAAVLMEFTDRLISKIELFYDGRPFAEKKNEIFEDASN
ncbi:MAG: nuclear transport factor 2 family protein [Alphaproteobacteria bacterium]